MLMIDLPGYVLGSCLRIRDPRATISELKQAPCRKKLIFTGRCAWHAAALHASGHKLSETHRESSMVSWSRQIDQLFNLLFAAA
jgi:hypothetical protein